MRLEGLSHFVVFAFVADYYCVGVEFNSLLYEELGTVVCSEKLYFEQVLMLTDYIESLSSDRTG